MALFVFAHHRHTGKKLHHGRTSYATLTFLLMLCGVVLSAYTVNVSAATVPQAQNPQDGSIGLTGAVRGPAPTQAATILIPGNGFRLSSSPTTVSGKCPVNTYVSLYRNNIFSGIVPCSGDGTFSILADLFPGSNRLQTKVSDTLGQSGPDSNIVDVFYSAANASVPNVVLTNPLFLQSLDGVIGISPNQSLTRSIKITGGMGPYAVSWDFGDGTVIAIPQNSEGTASAAHAYSRAGTYSVIVRVTDSSNNSAIIQLVTVVNGATSTTIANTKNKLDLPGVAAGAWPLYILALLMVLIFWLGERRELWQLRRQNRVMPGV